MNAFYVPFIHMALYGIANFMRMCIGADSSSSRTVIYVYRQNISLSSRTFCISVVEILYKYIHIPVYVYIYGSYTEGKWRKICQPLYGVSDESSLGIFVYKHIYKYISARALLLLCRPSDASQSDISFSHVVQKMYDSDSYRHI